MSTTDTSTASVTLEGIQKARRRISDRIFYSPCPHSANISKLSSQDVFLKLENLQQTGSFKERGALNKLLTLTSAEKARGVIAASAGNHAQGVAYHAQQLGISAKIVMPTMTPRVKINAVLSLQYFRIIFSAHLERGCWPVGSDLAVPTPRSVPATLAFL